MKLLAIDPGTSRGAAVLWDMTENRVCYAFERDNADLLSLIKSQTDAIYIRCERLECFGMPVGAEVFETAYWIGRAMEASAVRYLNFQLVSRRAVKLHFCGSARAKDGNVAQALRDRLGDKGTKAKPGPLYGIAGHCWQALAIAVYAADHFKEASAE